MEGQVLRLSRPHLSARVILPVICLVALMALPGRAGGMPAAPSSASTAASPALASGGLFDAVGPPQGTPALAPVASNALVGFDVGLTPSDPSGLATFDRMVQDPSSPLYHHYLTSSQFLSDFGPSLSAQTEVSSYLESHGATHVAWTADRMTVSFSLPAGDVASAFGTSLAWYPQAQGGEYYAPTGSPHLPASLTPLIAGVDGLTDRSNGALRTFLRDLGPLSVASSPATSSDRGPAEYDEVTTGGQVFWGTDFDGAFDAMPLLNAGDTGSGWSVATLLWSGFNATDNVNLPPFDPTAIQDYYQQTFPASWTPPTPNAEPVTFGGATPPGPGTSTLGDDGGGILENSLDLEMVGSTAPGATIYCFYFAGSLLSTSSLSSLFGPFDTALGQALSFAYPGHGLAAISMSFGLPDSNDTTWDTLEEQAESQGVSLLASSGDAGDAPASATGRPQGQWPPWPATASFQSWGETAVGGTTIQVSGVPCGPAWGGVQTATFPTMCYGASSITGLSSQSIWYSNGSSVSSNSEGTSGSEGGVSQVFDEPLWQAQSTAQGPIELAAAKEGYNASRATADIASVGNDTIVFTASNPLSGNEVAGTSVASPVMAGFLADIAQQRDLAGGYLDPPIYAIGSYFEIKAKGSNADPFGGLDQVSSGNNWVYNATNIGWAPATGWGTPDVALLSTALSNPTYTSYVYNSDAVRGIAGPVTAPPSGKSASGSTAFPLGLVAVVAAILFLSVLMIAIYVVSSRRHRAPASPPPAPASGWPAAAGAAPPASTGWGYGSVAPVSPPPPASAYPPPPPGYGSPYGYAAPPPPAASYAAPPPSYACRYCGRFRPYNTGPCPYCSAPL